MIERRSRASYYHAVVAHGNTLYLSGAVANDISASMKVQTLQVLDNIASTLVAHGSDPSKILSATVYISDFDQRVAMNEAWEEWFEPDNLPARATIGVASLGKGVLIEIVVTAAR